MLLQPPTEYQQPDLKTVSARKTKTETLREIVSAEKTRSETTVGAGTEPRWREGSATHRTTTLLIYIAHRDFGLRRNGSEEKASERPERILKVR
jgi:hypothetical protein